MHELLHSTAIAFVGRHNSGKTAIVCAVIEELTRRGFDVGSIKHHGHVGFEIDVPGKDSYRHRYAGATEVVVASPDAVARIKNMPREVECSQLLEEVMPHFLNRTMTEDLYRDIRSKETDIIRDANIAEAGHLKRVHDGDCTFEQGLTFIEALNSINRIANHLSSIAEVGHDEDRRLLAESTMSGYLV